MRAARFQESVVENNELLFTFRLVRGAASKSFGLIVAKAAGLPLRILEAAREKSEEFEAHCRSRAQQQASVRRPQLITRRNSGARRTGRCTRLGQAS